MVSNSLPLAVQFTCFPSTEPIMPDLGNHGFGPWMNVEPATRSSQPGRGFGEEELLVVCAA
jgi:hypothetical protein